MCAIYLIEYFDSDHVRTMESVTHLQANAAATFELSSKIRRAFFALLRQQNKQIKQCVDSDSNSIYRNPGKHYQQKKSSHCQLDLNCKRTS